jgi:hypothetical protein
VERAISVCGHVVVDMAGFSAADQVTAERCQEQVRSCDVYVGVLGTRYGSPVREEPEVSYTELEFNTATEAGLPRLVFLLDTNAMDVGIPLPALLDREFGVRQDAFRRRVQESGMVTQLFGNPAMLGQLVERSLRGLAEQRARRPMYGSAWSGRGDRPKIFLCYRRDDTQGFARGIYQSLAGRYGHEQVFRDIDSTPAGVRYATWIESRVGQCNVMVALIGDAWLSTKDGAGHRRLDSPKDWVRQEIEAALARDIPIVPVRIQGARMPSEEDLPSSIADLAGFQYAEVTDSRWDFDVELLMQAIDNLIASDPNNYRKLQFGLQSELTSPA